MSSDQHDGRYDIWRWYSVGQWDSVDAEQLARPFGRVKDRAKLFHAQGLTWPPMYGTLYTGAGQFEPTPYACQKIDTGGGARQFLGKF